MAKATKPPEPTPTVEEALAELEALVRRLEEGEGDLEQALSDFERGVHLVRSCGELLTTMELRVQQLVVTEDGEILAGPFGADGSEEDEQV
jgi:exodeoxyribonuclease VII small subunit